MFDSILRFGDENKILIAKDQGIKNAYIGMIASRMMNFPAYITFAVMEKESGGKNIWGGDDGSTFEKHHNLEVTEAAYLEYQIELGIPNGIGPMQLTAKELQHDADSIGGVHVPLCNIITGIDFIEGLMTEEDGILEAVFTRYNGAASYGADMANVRIPRWKELMKSA